MLFWPGRLVRVSLIDGDTITGRVRFSWWPFTTLRLSDVKSPAGDGEVEAEGIVVVPHRSVLLVQVVG